MAVLLELGPGVAVSPVPYQNFIRQQCAGLKRPLHKDDINTVLAQEPYRVTLCRHKNDSKKKSYNLKKERMTNDYGDWYLKFEDDAALLAFQLRWS